MLDVRMSLKLCISLLLLQNRRDQSLRRDLITESSHVPPRRLSHVLEANGICRGLGQAAAERGHVARGKDPAGLARHNEIRAAADV